MLIKESKYVLISIHNTVVIWDCMTDERFPSSSCQEQCILYLFICINHCCSYCFVKQKGVDLHFFIILYARSASTWGDIDDT